VICCRVGADAALTALRALMSRLRLTVNEAKTRLCRGPDEHFDFLGYTIGTCYSPQTGWAYTGVRPSAQKVQRLKRQVSEQTTRGWLWLDVDDLVARLNQMLGGWVNYFRLGTVTAV
jgi:RNA-directed DNA polymerase